MKKYLLKYTVIVVFLVLFGCSKYVDVVPDNVAVIEDAFETRDGTERFLATLYGYLPRFSSINNPALLGGDEVLVQANRTENWMARRMALGGQNVDNPLLNYWSGGNGGSNLFIALRDCNIFLENVSLPFDITDDEINLWSGEAKFLKAYYHFYLMRMYGPIPIIKENISIEAGVNEVRVSRDSVDDVVGYIIELLDESIELLPEQIENVARDLGKPTKGIALALKSRVLVTAASPLFNGNTDYVDFVDQEGNHLINQTYDPNKWVIAAEACREAIENAHNNGHELFQFVPRGSESFSERTIKKLSIRGSVTSEWLFNDELIWGSSDNPVTILQNWAQGRLPVNIQVENRQSVQGWWAPTMRIAEMFYSKNGVPIDEDPSFNYEDRFEVSTAGPEDIHYVVEGYETASLHLNREPRFYASMGFDGGIWEGHGVNSDEGGNGLFIRAKFLETAGLLDVNSFSLSGFFAKKLVNYRNVQATNVNSYSRIAFPFPLFRLADLYLLYAEALNESQGPQAAYQWIDLVRERAGLEGVEDSWANYSDIPSKPSTKEGLRDIIHHERLIELVFEGHRFWDLRRWKKALTVASGPARGWNIEGRTTESFYNVVDNGIFLFQLKNYFWPIAERDIVRNPNLIQNPFW